MVVSNIGMVPHISVLYTSNAGPYTATVQTALTDDHEVSSFEYMNRISTAIEQQLPDVRTFFRAVHKRPRVGTHWACRRL